MKKLTIVFLTLTLSFMLIGCTNVQETLESKKINKVTATFSIEENEQIKDKEVVLEQAEEIEIILHAIENATPHLSGPMTTEGENVNLIFTYEDNSSEVIHLWLYPDRNAGRVQKENDKGPVQLLSEEDVQHIAELLDEEIW